MKVIRTSIPDVLILEPQVFGDERGFLLESFNARRFCDAVGLDIRSVQDNRPRSRRSVLRGLHYQIKQPQGKLARVVSGRRAWRKTRPRRSSVKARMESCRIEGRFLPLGCADLPMSWLIKTRYQNWPSETEANIRVFVLGFATRRPGRTPQRPRTRAHFAANREVM